MQKKLIIFIFIFISIILLKYFYSNYEIKYNINNYKIYTKSENNRVYFEIEKDNKYNFDIYTKSKRKIVIGEIKEINNDKYNCIIPIIKNYDTYPLCYDIKNNYNVDYYLIEDSLVDEYKLENQTILKPDKDFIYYNNLSSNEYVALWTYKGYTIMNGKEYRNIIIFNKDRYDNELAYMVNNIIIMPNYDEKFEFSKLVLLNIVNGNISYIDLANSIDYDSYIVGNIKNKIYIYDNKNSTLYSIDIDSGAMETVANDKSGYIKYENKKFIDCDKTDYSINKIKYTDNSINNQTYNYSFDNGTYKTINDNKNILTKINNKNIIKIFEKNNNLYYALDNAFYKYNPLLGNRKIFYDYELEFNKSKTIFMYSK